MSQVVVHERLPVEEFPALKQQSGFVHCFVGRVPAIDVRQDKEEALRRLDAIHRKARAGFGLADARFITAQQVHGDGIGIVEESTKTDECLAGCDGLITDRPEICLGIYVADCCAVYLVDPVRRAIGLVHSGRKGTELGIVGKAIDLMAMRFGSKPQDLVAQLSPCVRPPHFEIDFAADIVATCRERGVIDIHDAGVCTACDLQHYYSYRAEKGKTGRMLALLAMIAAAA